MQFHLRTILKIIEISEDTQTCFSDCTHFYVEILDEAKNKIKQKEKSLYLIHNEKQQEHPSKEGNNIYATIRVKEIVEGLTEQDFRAKNKEKAFNFKQQLDQFVEQEDIKRGEDVFMGMTDAEILVNKKEWTALGLM